MKSVVVEGGRRRKEEETPTKVDLSMRAQLCVQI